MKKTKKGLLLGILMLMTAICLLFAACGSGKVKISFDTAGGPPVEAVELDPGETYTLPIPPVREGYSFEGWYADAAYSGTQVTSVTAESNTTFYAKWEQMYPINLQLGGGSLEGSTTLYAKEGTNVSTFMQDYVPTLQDHQFGEWLVGDSPLSRSYTLTKEGVTLTAHYKVAYTAELYLQKLENTAEYEKAAEDFVGYEYAGPAFSPAPEVDGFVQVQHDGAVATKDLTENVSENKYKLYFDRKEISLVLQSNYPRETGLAAENTTLSARYGAEIDLPAAYSLEGYLLVGWSASGTGEVDYRSSQIDSMLRNGTFGSDLYKVEKSNVLFAVWEKGYTDLFGGDDYIFHFTDDAEEVYLLRGGALFLGSYNARTGSFLFTAPGSDGYDRSVAEGKLNADGTFSYFSETRDGFSYYYFKNGVGKDENYRINLDGYNGLTYIDGTRPPLDNESKGSYSIDENGLLHVTYTEGHLAGQSFVYALSNSGRNGAIFMVRDDEELGWGAIPRAAINNGQLTYYISAYALTLNGFGNAVYAGPDGDQSYYYLREDDVITVMNAMGVPQFEAHLTTVQGRLVYLLYSSSYDVTYESGAAKLKLDGMYQATYTDANGAATEGTYTLYSSTFGTLVQFYYPDPDSSQAQMAQRLFLVRTERETVVGEDGESQNYVYHYYFDEEPLSYNEYRYLEGSNIYSTLITVVNDKEEGKATVYGYAATGYVPVLFGTVTEGDEEGLYLFETESVNEEAVLASQPFDIAAVKAFVFATDIVVSSSGSMVPVTYWLSMTTETETTEYDVCYTAADGSTLVLIRGFGIYTPANGEPITGICATSNGITSLYNAINQVAYYFELTDGDSEHTFTLLTGIIGTFPALLENGYSSSNETLTFNGKNGAVYAVTTAGDEGSTTVTHEGTYADTGDKSELSGLTIYQFTEQNGISFKFILVSMSSSGVYFAKFNESVNGEYTSDDGTLVLDGFSLIATYDESATGNSYRGVYVISAENVIQMITDETVYFFDLKEQKSFTVRDAAYGDYLYANNRSIGEFAFRFDGYGHLSGVSASTGETVFEGGTYEKLDENYYRLTYTLEGHPESLVGWLGTITISSTNYNAFYMLYNEIVMSYINEEDWSVLALDNRGNATMYDKDGKVETGYYTIVTDTMLYYVNQAGSDACIYIYDKQKRTAKPIRYTERAYYTQDFAAMLFTSYGFMMMDGETRYYYNVAENGDVLLYRRDDSDPKANQYGFVGETFFGRFTDEKDIDGKKYFQSSSMKLIFSRKEETKTKFPVPTTDDEMLQIGQLEFSPTGSAEFTDTEASVWIGENKMDCTVSRVLVEEGKYQMYIRLQNFVFEIDVTYRGDYDDDVSEYEVTAMRTELTMYSYTYLYYLLNYMMQGYVIPNTFGYVSLVTEFDEAGVAGTPQATGEFGLDSGFVDSKGEPIAFENVAYTYEDGMYSISCKGTDDYTYTLHIAPDSTFVNYIGMYAYRVYAFTRTEVFASEGYTVTAERVLSTENPYISVGGYWTLMLSKDGQEMPSDAGYILDGTVYYFVRTREEETEKILSSDLYVIVFTKRTPEGTDDTVEDLDPYASAIVTARKLKVAYTQDETSYVEYDDSGIVLLYNGRSTYLFEAEDCSYDAQSNTYTLTTASRVFTVTIDETTGIATITEAAAPAAEEGAQA